MMIRSGNNVWQDDYLRLRAAEGTRMLSDEEAKGLLCDWYGFAGEKITIHHSVPAYRAGGDSLPTLTGEFDRVPLYSTRERHYIRFDCGCMHFELYNDDLRMYIDERPTYTVKSAGDG